MFVMLKALRATMIASGQVPLYWQVSESALWRLSADPHLHRTDHYIDGLPLTILGLPFEIGPTASGREVELIADPHATYRLSADNQP